MFIKNLHENLNELKKNLCKYYKNKPFSLGLHTTTGKATAEEICKTGLETNSRKIEGTLKIYGDYDKINVEDLNYFFSYTDHTIVVAIPDCFETPRIGDNLGGDTSLCEFSRFVEVLSIISKSNNRSGYNNGLPSYYILGYYDKNFNFVENPDCYLINNESNEKLNEDIISYKNNIELLNFLDIF